MTGQASESVRIEERTCSIVENAAEFRLLIDRSRRHLRGNKDERAAEDLQQAASFAWFNHPGFFVDPELESLLRAIGGRLPAGRNGRRKEPAGAKRVVLHVATQLYETGGHTQMLGRWILDDSGSDHRVVTIRQGSTPFPEKVTQMLSENPLQLDRVGKTLLDRARCLRQLAQDADFVIVHAHPDDVVPAIALAGQATPSIYVNHADHVFWAGASIATILLHLRNSGAELSVARRAVPQERSFLMNRPLLPAVISLSRACERKKLGIETDQVVLVTAASSTKYVPIDDAGLLPLLEAAVLANPRLVVFAAGPLPTGAWAMASSHTGGRITALGPLQSVQGLFTAADIYVDSYPFSSLTSLLEAGSHGLPCVSYRGHSEECAVLGADSPDVEREINYPNSEHAFLDVISQLGDDPGIRREQGDQLREVIHKSHGHSWGANLENLYEWARSAVSSRPESLEQAVSAGPLDVAVAALQERTGYALGTVGAHRSVLGVMSPLRRVAVWLKVRRSGIRVRPAELLSDNHRIRFEESVVHLRRLMGA